MKKSIILSILIVIFLIIYGFTRGSESVALNKSKEKKEIQKTIYGTWVYKMGDEGTIELTLKDSDQCSAVGFTKTGESRTFKCEFTKDYISLVLGEKHEVDDDYRYFTLDNNAYLVLHNRKYDVATRTVKGDGMLGTWTMNQDDAIFTDKVECNIDGSNACYKVVEYDTDSNNAEVGKMYYDDYFLCGCTDKVCIKKYYELVNNELLVAETTLFFERK